MAQYKLTYFQITALAEPIRFLFNYAGIPFEDVRVEFENWPKLKPTIPFGQMPVLEHKGQVINQSLAIARYVAKLAKLTGKDDWENLQIDSMVDNVNDLRTKIGAYHYEKDEKVKAEKANEVFNETVPYYLQRLNASVEKNNGYLAVGRLTWADLFFIALLDYINFMAKKNIIADYPALVKLEKTVLELPAIKKWVDTRPKNAM